jgi:CheY-like chemotaxis protein
MKKVLVVDDQQDCSDPMARLLRVCGFEAECAADGVEALSKLENFGPDVILLDLAMPGMDGFDFLRALRGLPRWVDLPVVVFSAYYNEQMHTGLRLLGVSDCFSKGQTDFEILIARIDEFCGQKDAAGRQRKILLVEDDQETSSALARLLADYGYEVTRAATPADAVKQATEKKFDLTVVDLGLPDRESVRMLQNLLAQPQTKSLGLTNSGSKDVRQAEGEGFSRLLTKPVPVDRLMETIKGMTG